jgi:hypothetical protein
MTTLDDKLREFLEADERERSEGFTKTALARSIANIADKLVEHERQDNEHHAAVMSEVQGLNWRVGSLEQNATRLEKELDDTGQHNLEAIRTAAEARGLAMRRRSSNPPGPIGKLVEKALEHGTVRVLLILAVAACGWLARHFGPHP